MDGGRALVVAAVLLAVPLAGCAGNGGDDAVTEYTVEADEWSLSPANVTVPAGEEITVTFENVGSNQHNYGVDLDGDGDTEDDVRTETIPKDESVELTFTVDEPGTYAVFCDVPGHRGAGMEGTLTVE